MKKHDEGYVLVYVTVVLLVFCLVATTILTGAMRNLEHQQVANQKMKDQYVAAGMIEQVIAKRNSYDFQENVQIEVADAITGEKNTESVVCKSIKDDIVTLVVTYNTAQITCRFDIADGSFKDYQLGTVEVTQ